MLPYGSLTDFTVILFSRNEIGSENLRPNVAEQLIVLIVLILHDESTGRTIIKHKLISQLPAKVLRLKMYTMT